MANLKYVMVAFFLFIPLASFANPTVHTYVGQGEFEPGTKMDVRLAVIMDSNQPNDLVKKNVIIDMRLPSSGVGLSFNSGQWDTNANELGAVEIFYTYNQYATATIACTNFQFVASGYDFSCQYSTTLKPDPMTLTFRAP